MPWLCNIINISINLTSIFVLSRMLLTLLYVSELKGDKVILFFDYLIPFSIGPVVVQVADYEFVSVYDLRV
jgi:hypothetical protein